MRCPFCGRVFSEEDAHRVCRSCAVFGGCKNVKCPYCGYEMPREPALVRWLRSWSRRRRGER